MTNTTGMVILAGIALAAGGFKVVRGDYQLGGIDRPVRCSDLATPAGQKYQLEQVQKNIVEGRKILAQLHQENNAYPPGTVVNIRSCDGSTQTVKVPPGGLHAQKIAECQAKLQLAEQYYDGMLQRQGQAVKVRSHPQPLPAEPIQVAQNQPPRASSGPIISRPMPDQKLGTTYCPRQ